MKSMIAILVVLISSLAYADYSATQKLDFVNSVLATNIMAVADDQQHLYSVEGYGTTALASGVTVEYGSIADQTERERRGVAGPMPVLDGVVVTNIVPFSPFCFGLRAIASDGAVTVRRLDLEPLCWAGGVLAVDKPVNAGNDTVVCVYHSQVVIASNVVRRLSLESGFSLVSLSRVSHVVKSEQIYDYNNRKMLIYNDGKLVTDEDFPDPDSTSCLATGIVRDENGIPLADQPVSIRWRKNVSTFRSVRPPTYYEDNVSTDQNGYFEKKLRGAAGATLTLRRNGYVTMTLSKDTPMFPVDITMIPLPVGSDNVKRYTGNMYNKQVSLAERRAFGISFDEISSGSMKGLTTNRLEADLWFEIGRSEAECVAQYNRIVGENSHPVPADWEEWIMVVSAQHGTEVKEAGNSIQEGLTLDGTLREADADGYTTNIVGYVIKEGTPASDNPGNKHVLSSNYYFRKNGRYGRLGGLKFHLVSREKYNRDLGRPVASDFIWWFHLDSFWMQSEVLGHRALEPIENLQN